MNTTIRMTLAAALAAATFAPLAHAETMSSGEEVSIVYIRSLDSGSNRATYNTLSQKAEHPNLTQDAQAEASSDPAISGALAEREIALHNVVQVDTAANGAKIVYVR